MPHSLGWLPEAPEGHTGPPSLRSPWHSLVDAPRASSVSEHCPAITLNSLEGECPFSIMSVPRAGHGEDPQDKSVEQILGLYCHMLGARGSQSLSDTVSVLTDLTVSTWGLGVAE